MKKKLYFVEIFIINKLKKIYNKIVINICKKEIGENFSNVSYKIKK